MFRKRIQLTSLRPGNLVALGIGATVFILLVMAILQRPDREKTPPLAAVTTPGSPNIGVTADMVVAHPNHRAMRPSPVVPNAPPEAEAELT